MVYILCHTDVAYCEVYFIWYHFVKIISLPILTKENQRRAFFFLGNLRRAFFLLRKCKNSKAVFGLRLVEGKEDERET